MHAWDQLYELGDFVPNFFFQLYSTTRYRSPVDALLRRTIGPFTLLAQWFPNSVCVYDYLPRMYQVSITARRTTNKYVLRTHYSAPY